MTAKNINFFQANNFKFEIQRLSSLPFFIRGVNLPGIQFGLIDVETPFSKISFSGDKLTYSELTLEFIVNEDLSNYFEIVDWIKGMAFETSFDDYKSFIKSEKTVVSDATLVLTSNSSVPKISILFEDLFPISIDDIPLTVENENTIIVSTTFRFRRWSHKNIV